MYAVAPGSLADIPRPNAEFWTEIRDVKPIELDRNLQIGSVLINQRFQGAAEPIVAIGGFLSDVTTPDRGYEALQLSSLNRPALLIDMPGHGISSPHNFRQIYDLCFRHSADSTADTMIKAVQKELGKTEPIDYFGISHGGHLALKMTELEDTDRVRTVFGLDISGTRHDSTLAVQKGYLWTDRRRRHSYYERLAGSAAKRDYESFQWSHWRLGPQRASSFVVNNPALFVLNFFSSVNARPGALEAWRNIMNHRSARVEVVTGKDSHVADHQAIEEFIRSLPFDQRWRSRQTSIRYEDHNISMTELLPRAVQWAAKAYAWAA